MDGILPPLTEEEILAEIDEYSIYSYYLGYEPLLGAAYPSPIRSGVGANRDVTPSFSVYEPTRHVLNSREFMWHDNALGISGGVFRLVKLMYGFTTELETYQQVLSDFGLIPGTTRKAPLELPQKKEAVHSDISIVSAPFEPRHLNFLARCNITTPILQRFGTRALKCFWLADVQSKPVYPRGIGFAYPIWDKYQLYCPFDSTRKFRTSYNDACLPGLLQLQYNSDLLIITKSWKDLMCLTSFGYEAVACRSENTLVPEVYMTHFRKHYKHILILFDNDGKHKGDVYPERKIYVPRLLPTDKDVSDFCINHSIQPTAEMLYQITNV